MEREGGRRGAARERIGEGRRKRKERKWAKGGEKVKEGGEGMEKKRG